LSIEQLEESISLPELEMIIKAQRDKERRRDKFVAAMKGIDLDEHEHSDEVDEVEEIRLKVIAEHRGVDVEQVRFEEADNGLGYELEE
jgi:hypothetical protein